MMYSLESCAQDLLKGKILSRIDCVIERTAFFQELLWVDASFSGCRRSRILMSSLKISKSIARMKRYNKVFNENFPINN